jgi:septum formation protein
VREDAPRIVASRSGLLVLASGSAARARMLRAAGVPFLQDPADLDEASAKAALRRSGARADAAALELARLKAAAVAQRHPDRLVLGADQLLDCAGEWLDKPMALPRARDQLLHLSGRGHRLSTAAVLLRRAQVAWSHVETPEVTLRPLSTERIDAYLAAAGEEALHSVGAYQIEGLGAQLIERLDGDVFAVLGLPLLSLLAALRREGVLP